MCRRCQWFQSPLYLPCSVLPPNSDSYVCCGTIVQLPMIFLQVYSKIWKPINVCLVYHETIRKVCYTAKQCARLTFPFQRVCINLIWIREVNLLWVLFNKGFITEIRIYTIVRGAKGMGSGKESRMMLEKFLASLPRALAWMGQIGPCRGFRKPAICCSFQGRVIKVHQ